MYLQTNDKSENAFDGDNSGNVGDEDKEDDEDEEDEEHIERKKKQVAQNEAKEHDIYRIFENLGLKPFPDCIVSREEWGAINPQTKGLPMEHPVANVVFTYTTGVDRCEESEECVKAIQLLQQRHMTDNKMSDIGFK